MCCDFFTCSTIVIIIKEFIQNSVVTTTYPQVVRSILIWVIPMENNAAQQPNLDQDEHDSWISHLTEQKFGEIAKGLTALAHSKAQSAIDSSRGLPTPSTPSEARSNKPMPIRELTQQEMESRLDGGLVIFGALHRPSSSQNLTQPDADELAEQAVLQQQLERALVLGGSMFEVPVNAKLFDVDGVPVARLADGSCIAFGSTGTRPYLDSAKVFSYGSPIEVAEFEALVAALKASV